MNGGDRLSDHETILGQIVHKPDEMSLSYGVTGRREGTADRDERRSGNAPTVTPQRVQRQVGVKRMLNQLLVDQEEVGVVGNDARPMDMERRDRKSVV